MTMDSTKALIEYATLDEALTARQAAWRDDGEGNGIPNEFYAIELVGEIGELFNVVKKLMREAYGVRGSRATQQDMEDEFGDALICLKNMAARYAVDLERAARNKFNATSEKYGFPHRVAVLSAQGEAAQPAAEGWHRCGLPDVGTYKGQVVLAAPDWLRDKWPDGIGIDVCLALEIQSLWQAGVKTSGHCCGHGRALSYIGVWPESIETMRALGYTAVAGSRDHFTPKSLPASDGWDWIVPALQSRLKTLSSREIAKQVGCGHATICRTAKGKEPSVSNYFAMKKWLNSPNAASQDGGRDQ